eukprot:TRINITY_DN1082_c0_g1_i2.p2 TRINITY_DN1082_c0_g1~~TRINITY_DN1082_c0_g1_i2.p2  ORF type:complete len:172 (+),score=12.79 TRINITY_DN1082_c0_g1_i2:214-729(+)
MGIQNIFQMRTLVLLCFVFSTLALRESCEDCDESQKVCPCVAKANALKAAIKKAFVEPCGKGFYYDQDKEKCKSCPSHASSCAMSPNGTLYMNCKKYYGPVSGKGICKSKSFVFPQNVHMVATSVPLIKKETSPAAFVLPNMVGIGTTSVVKNVRIILGVAISDVVENADQ